MKNLKHQNEKHSIFRKSAPSARPRSSFLRRVALGAQAFAQAVKSGDAWMGPLEPQTPEVAPPAPPRELDYPIGFNTLIEPRASEPISFAELRALADGYDLLRIVIETRKDQLAALPWAVRPRASAHDDPGAHERARMVEEFLRRPDRIHSFERWQRALVEEMLVIDAASVYIRTDRLGRVFALEVIDGATIAPKVDLAGRIPDPPETAYQQVIHGVPYHDFTRRELIYAPRNLRPYKIYGLSPVEQIIMTINLGLRRQFDKLAYYTEGTTPDTWVGVPDNWNVRQLREFQDYFNALLSGNPAERRKVRFVPGGMKIQPVKEPALKDDYDEWLARVVCYAFSISPSAFVRDNNRATAETLKQNALEEGLMPLMSWFKQDLMDRLIEEAFGFDDVEFVWQTGTPVAPAQQSQIDEIQISHGMISINEWRRRNNLPPVAGGDEPLLMLGSTPIPLRQFAAPEPTADPTSPRRAARSTASARRTKTNDDTPE